MVPSESDLTHSGLSGSLKELLKDIIGENPNISNKLKKLDEEFAALNDIKPEDLTTLRKALGDIDKTLGSIQEEIARTDIQKNLGKEKLRLANCVLCFMMGAAQTSYASVALASSAAAKTMGYAPSLVGGAAHAAAIGTGIGLAAVYLVRGSVMVGRSAWNHYTADCFHEAFQGAGETGKQDALQLMQEAERLGPDYLKGRLSADCLQEVDSETGAIRTYTAHGIEDAEGDITAYTEGQVHEYLERVDKAVATQKLKCWVSAIVGLSFILGAALLIATTVLTGGIAPIILGLFSAMLFLSGEVVFISYDHSKVFEWLRDKNYHKPVWLGGEKQISASEKFLEYLRKKPKDLPNESDECDELLKDSIAAIEGQDPLFKNSNIS